MRTLLVLLVLGMTSCANKVVRISNEPAFEPWEVRREEFLKRNRLPSDYILENMREGVEK